MRTWIFVSLLVIVGSFLRLYNVSNTLTFQGDQGRDALIAKAIFRDGDIALIGPVTSVGNMYLGPFYYYFMVPWLALTYPNPVGPAYGVALVNCLSLVALYVLLKKHAGEKLGFIALLLYAIMPLAVKFSRFSWNPNLGAPIAILLFWSIVSWYKKPSFRMAIGIGFWFGLLIQLHYVALTTVGVIGSVVVWKIFRDRSHLKIHLIHLLLMAITTLSLLTPLVVFDVRHDKLISNRFKDFFTTNEQHIQPLNKLFKIIRETEGRSFRVISQLITTKKQVLFDTVITYGFLIVTLMLIIKRRRETDSDLIAYIAITWVMFTILGIAFYSSSVFDHYLTYCFPALIIWWSWVIWRLFCNNLWQKVLATVLLLGISYISIIELSKMQFNGYGATILANTAKIVAPEIKPPYNIALLSLDRDFQGMNYRYFFSTLTNKPLANDNYQNLNQLIVIDEVKEIDPLISPAFEIQEPGLRRLTKTIDIELGPRIFIYER